MSNNGNYLREFGRFRLDAKKKVLWFEGEPVNLQLKEIELLCVLTENGGEVLTKDELLNRVWTQSFVEESNLSRHIYRLRKMFREFGEAEDLIQTVPRRGYRFTANVRELGNVDDENDLIIEKHTVSQTFIEEIDADPPPVPDGNSDKLKAAGGSSSPDSGGAPEKRFWRNVSALPQHRVTIPTVAIIAACALLIAFGGWRYAGSKRNSNTVSSAVAAGGAHQRFVGGDKVLTDFGFPVEKAQAVALQADGKIVVGGWVGENSAKTDFALARYNADGTLDRTFDGDGKVITPLGEYVDPLYGLAIQPDGKILAVGAFSTGANSRRFAVLRYRPDGALDAGFDEDGIAAFDIGNGAQDTAYAALVLADGKILVAGSAMTLHKTDQSQIGQNDFAVIRLNPNGTLDTTFGDGGKVITGSGYGSDVAYALILQTDGKILVGGMMASGKNQVFGLVRYHAAGALDETFGTAGKVRTEFFEEGSIIWSLALAADGKIVAAGYAIEGGVADFALARYDTDGSLDNSFDGDGRLTFEIEGGGLGREVFVQPDGRILVGGRSGAGTETGFGFARVWADGRLDESFHGTGTAAISFQTPVEVHGMILTADGYAVAVGRAIDNKSSDFALARISLSE
jgi:uncharacterized delta-60 repeat protein